MGVEVRKGLLLVEAPVWDDRARLGDSPVANLVASPASSDINLLSTHINRFLHDPLWLHYRDVEGTSDSDSSTSPTPSDAAHHKLSSPSGSSHHVADFSFLLGHAQARPSLPWKQANRLPLNSSPFADNPNQLALQFLNFTRATSSNSTRSTTPLRGRNDRRAVR